MNWTIVIFVGVNSIISSCAADNRASPRAGVQTIPLDKIWAFEMPRARDVRELEGDKFGEKVLKLPSNQQSALLHQALTTHIRLALQNSKKSRDGFAVMGTRKSALKGAYDVLVKGQKIQSSFPVDSDITLVFFSHQFGQHVHLTRIERDGNTINVFYQFVPHETREVPARPAAATK
jgi:hypothetical protein